MIEIYAKILTWKLEEDLNWIIEQFDQDLLPPFVLTVIRGGGGGGAWTLECFFVSDVTQSVGSVNCRLETGAIPAQVSVKTQLQQQETINQIKHFWRILLFFGVWGENYDSCQHVPHYVLSTHILVLILLSFVILSEDCYCSSVKSS